jgi:RNA polymerase sigma-70 factor, ECF subfamily
LNPVAPPEPLSDDELLALIQRREPAALRALYDRHSAELYALCLKFVSSPADAQALLADVFCEFWQKVERFNPERAGVRTYLRVLCRSRAIDYQRSHACRVEHEQAAGAQREVEAASRLQRTDPAWQAVQGEEVEQLRRELQELSSAQRTALELAYFEGLSHQEIATRLSAPLGTVKTNIRTGLARLRAALRGREHIRLHPDCFHPANPK